VSNEPVLFFESVSDGFMKSIFPRHYSSPTLAVLSSTNLPLRLAESSFAFL
jgi:hypothetical protein